MTYSVDIKERVLGYVNEGGSKTEAARLYGVHRQTVYLWLSKEDLHPNVGFTRRRKLDKEALAAHVRDVPDAYLRERAKHFGVHKNAVWVALRRMNIVKKNDTIC